MVKTVKRSPTFNKKTKQFDRAQLKILNKLIKKILDNPKVGKPMSYERKGTRETYFKPFRLSYEFDERHDTLVFLNVYHKKRQ